MYRFLFRFVVTSLTILAASLITSAISEYMVSFRNSYKPITFSLIGMGIIVVVFYPLFLRLEEWITRFSVRLVKSGNSLAGRYLGLLITFLAGMMVLLYFYLKIWYQLDLFRIIIKGELSIYI